MDKELVVRGYTLMSEDGVSVRLEETIKRESIILSLSRSGKVETAALNKDMFDALMELRYNIDVQRPKPPKGEKEESARPGGLSEEDMRHEIDDLLRPKNNGG